MSAVDWGLSPDPTEVKRTEAGAVSREIWALPAEEAFLEAFLTDVFCNHWKDLRFGPLIEGAAYELQPVAAPSKLGVMDGYLTIFFPMGGHFHICIGENNGSPSHPTPPELKARRKPSKAQMFRSYGRDGKPVTWGFEMWNGQGEPMISIFFPNPFIEADDSLSETPDFARLTTWRAVSKTWLGREPEAIDEEGEGFGKGHG